MRECQIEGCGSPVLARGWCAKHYSRWQKHGDPHVVHVRARTRCCIEGCERYRQSAQGWCLLHYRRWKRNGDPLHERTPTPCCVEGCTRPRNCPAGFCRMHRKRLERHGDPLWTARVANRTWSGKQCLMEGCEREAKSKGYCSMHRHRVSRHGDPAITQRKGNGTRTDDEKSAQHRAAHERYRKTPHGKRAESLRRQVRRALGKDAPTEMRNALKAMLAAEKCPLCDHKYNETAMRRRTVDHIRPLRHGGTNDLGNLRVICQSCNSRKQAKWTE